MARMRYSWSTTLDPELYKKLKSLSESSRIPMTKLADEAISDLIKKHNKSNKTKKDKKGS